MNLPKPDACHEQLRRILESRTFRGAEALRNLLAFLVDWSLKSPETPPKEYAIATEVLRRPGDFDPHADPAVRVQVGRLRSKLTEYYSSEGAADPITIQVPKGSYIVTFGHRTWAPEASSVGHANGIRRDQAGVRYRTLAIVAGAAATLASAATWLALRPSPPPKQLEALWQPFTSSPEAPLVVFSNAAFTGSPREGLRYFRQGTDDPSAIIESYTGVGEVMAVRELVGLFSSLRHPIRVKRARLAMWDEDRDSNLVFVGSPGENAEVQVLYKRLEFRFKSRDWEPEVGRPGFTNSKPRPAEEPIYLARRYPPIVDDYALVALIPGLAPDRWAMMLGGCTTFGTGAAAEFVCRAHKVEELRRRLTERSSTGAFPPFEALIHIQLHKGAVTEMSLVAVHRRDDLLSASPARQ